MNSFILKVNPFDYQLVTVSWAAAYAVSIPVFHLLHSILVFGWPEDGYLRSMIQTGATYVATATLSVGMNFALSNYTPIPQRFIGFITLGATGLTNYFSVGKAMRGGNHEKYEDGFPETKECDHTKGQYGKSNDSRGSAHDTQQAEKKLPGGTISSLGVVLIAFLLYKYGEQVWVYSRLQQQRA
ncbi:unnamed protein product [Heterosigma akashiwo]